MNLPPPFDSWLAALLAHPLVRRAAWLGFLSLVGATTLVGYLFGLRDGFVGRTLSATLVGWLLLTGSVLGIGPLLAWASRRLGAGQPRRGRQPAARTPTTHPRSPLRGTPSSRRPNHPAKRW